MNESKIYVSKDAKEFHIMGKDFSYVFYILKNGQLGHLYYGKRLNPSNIYSQKAYYETYGNTCTVFENDESFSLDIIPQEYPSYGTSDYRQPAIEVIQEDGSHITDFKYDSYTIYEGKKQLYKLPSTFVHKDKDSITLEIKLKDYIINATLILSYTLFKESDVLVRSSKIINNGNKDLQIKRLLSMSIDFKSSNYEMLTLTGSWTRERHIQTYPLHKGLQSTSSTRGTSSTAFNPFFALKDNLANEHTGEVYGFNLIYSGNHIGQVEVDTFLQARVQQGINYFNFSFLLKKGDELESPESILVYSCNGLNKMSQKFHKFYLNHLIPPKWANCARPILVNNWEATYFDFNEDKILELAGLSKKIGAELFVLDDGWFGKRNNDKTSLGDWYCNLDKIPSGLKGLSEKICNMGLDFGIWIEPEMISKESELFKKYPNWVLQFKNRKLTTGRNQYVLDLSNPAVVKHIYETISDLIIKTEYISYIKWDFNRTLTEVGSLSFEPKHQQEIAHRYVMGMYELYSLLTKKFPHILIEGCAAGGGRFDSGILAYSPQIWTSDNTDAIERLKIQYGTSICYPISSMGAHVSTTPNHQLNRLTSLKTRGDVAVFGVLGYELDLTSLPDSELECIKKQIKWYKEHRKLILEGTFYRLKSPFDGVNGNTAWSVVSEDKNNALVGYYKVLENTTHLPPNLKIYGLKPDKIYHLIGTNLTFDGLELENLGIEINSNLLSKLALIEDFKGDFKSIILEFKAK